jgi:hypothetical protein
MNVFYNLLSLICHPDFYLRRISKTILFSIRLFLGNQIQLKGLKDWRMAKISLQYLGIFDRIRLLG